MADAYGSNYSAADALKRTPGTSVDAGVRRHKNIFALATEGGAANNLIGAIVREGQEVLEARMHTDANLSGINFTIGTDAVPAKYAAAQAGPNATSKTFVLKIGALDDGPLDDPETIKFFPSGALAGAGTVVTELFTSKR